MTSSHIIKVPLNRVEGDLEIKVQLEGDTVVDAWSSGLMYRGFEEIMQGRGPLDGLVITPRICGICSTAHLMAAARALDGIAGITPPPNAIKARNLALMTEILQSDMRHGFLVFMLDFLNPIYQNHELYEEARRRLESYKGRAVVDVIRETKKLLGILAIIGGQWPHSSYMVPGGIASLPNNADLLQCHLILKHFRQWYEQEVLGCTIERWHAIQSHAELKAWLTEKTSHRKGHLGFFIRFAKGIGLDRLGRAHDHFISFGLGELGPSTAVKGYWHPDFLFPPGFRQGTSQNSFDQTEISEHVAYSYFESYEGGRHPFDGQTKPIIPEQDGLAYSWAKAPRYRDSAAETGPLAALLVGGAPLFLDLIKDHGASVFTRQLARLVRPAYLIPAMETWIAEITTGGNFYTPAGEIEEGEGFGLLDVTRGALGHWVKIKEGVIDHYQIITPTAWNGSPRDSHGMRGPFEEALVGTVVADRSNPVELGHVIRSFDACLVCTVHTTSLTKNDRASVGRSWGV